MNTTLPQHNKAKHPHVVSISTDAVPAESRVSYWESELRRHLIGLRCSPRCDEGLTARQVSIDAGAVRLADIRVNANVVDRAPDLIRLLPSDSIVVTFMQQGSGMLYQRGQCVNLQAGDVGVYDSRRPYLMGGDAPMHMLHIELAAAEFQQRFPTWSTDQPALGKLARGPSVLYARALAELAGTCLGLGEQADNHLATDAGLFDQVCDLLASILGCTGSQGVSSTLSASHLLAAKVYIESRLADEDLSVQDVAQAVRISTRHLSRLFAREDTSPTEFILSRRLHRARAELSDPRACSDGVGPTAYRWGFSSHAHFSRVFKQRFGQAPSEFRKAHVR